MQAFGVKALRFFKREPVLPTSTMLMPVEANIKVVADPPIPLGTYTHQNSPNRARMSEINETQGF
jgi:hypothetical protein